MKKLQFQFYNIIRTILVPFISGTRKPGLGSSYFLIEVPVLIVVLIFRVQKPNLVQGSLDWDCSHK
jgi:uncharacterized membrane protein YqaE (UPF0057 family)